MKIDIVGDVMIRHMTDDDSRTELRRIRTEILFHRDSEKKDDKRLYDAILPEGADGMGFMTLPEDVLLKNCLVYFSRHPNAFVRHNYEGNFAIYLTGGDARKEIQRTRSLWRTHKRNVDNKRCWLEDERLYIWTIPEGSLILRPDMTIEQALERCRIYVPRQKVIWAEASG